MIRNANTAKMWLLVLLLF